jgi:hypothetical protein
MDLKAIWTSVPRAARIYLSAVGALSVAAIATVVTVAAAGAPLLAASPSPSPSPGSGTNYCSRFTGHVAANLGKSQSQVQKAISDAINQTIDDAVKNGDLTQSQANAIKAKVGTSSGQTCTGPGGFPRFGGRGGPGFGPGAPFPRAQVLGLGEYARALGISQSELQQDLQSGKTVKDVAASKGMDEAAFRTKLASVARADLDQQVKAGNLTQNQENAILQRIQTGPLPLWDQVPRMPKRPAPSPSTSTSAQT